MLQESTLDAVLRGLQEAGLHPMVLADVNGDGYVVVAVQELKPAAGWAALTPRERSVARLAGRAMTNQQIARRLGITRHTVNYHLRQIFKKLAITSRVSLAPYADETGG